MGFNVALGCWASTGTLIWPGVPDLVQRSVQHFHEAVSVGMVVDGRSVALAPTQEHQVKLAIALIDQIPGIPVDQNF